MNKKLVAVAVASALSPFSIVNADTANVDISVRLYPQFQISKTDGATPAGTTVSPLVGAGDVNGNTIASRREVNSQNSKIVFRGDADIGGGMKGIWQIDQAVELETGTGRWAANDAYAGISSRFGTVYLGRFNTVYKEMGEQIDFLGVKTSNFVSLSNILSKPGFSSSSAASFHLRRNNAVHYETPSFGGGQFLIDYSPDEGKTNNRNNRLLSYGAKWEAGPLFVGAAHEIHYDFFGGDSGNSAIANPTNGTVHTKDQGVRLSVGYKIGNTNLGADVAQVEYHDYGNVASGRFENYKHTAWAIGIEQRFGNIRAALTTGRSSAGTCRLAGGVACDTSGLSGKVLNLGASYEFGKRISVFTLWSKMTNDPSAIYNNLNNGDVAAGADITQAAIGIQIRM